jgi:cyanophycinase
LLLLVPACGGDGDSGDGDAAETSGTSTEGSEGEDSGSESGSTSGDGDSGTSESSGDGDTGSTGDGDSDSAGDGDGDQMPEPPPGLVRYVTGDPEDEDVDPQGPALVMMGGGVEVDEAFSWWNTYVNGGDVVVIRTSGSDGYNDYLYSDIGGIDSVETMMVTSVALANDPYVAWTVAHAEGIWMAGGDQATYVNNWKGTALEDAMHAAWERGAAIGGTSAGLAVLGEFAFSALNDPVYPDELLEDPYNMYATMENDFLSFSLLQGVVTDSHFFERDRMGRLVGFMARVVTDGWASAVTGVGIDEETAMVVAPSGDAEVMGNGSVYIVHHDQAPTQCEAGQALEWSGLSVYKLSDGDTANFPAGTTGVTPSDLAASGGALNPANPY